MEGSGDWATTVIQNLEIQSGRQQRELMPGGQEASPIVLGQGLDKEEDPEEEGSSYVAE